MNGSIKCRKYPLIGSEMFSITLNSSRLMHSSYQTLNRLLAKKEVARPRKEKRTQGQYMVLVPSLVDQCKKVQVKVRVRCSLEATKVKLP